MANWLDAIRVRMIVSSILVKHLAALAPGAEWFWDTLLDADLASNSLGWQWVSCGADAAPYLQFSIQLPRAKFDPDGHYVRRYVPELRGLDAAVAIDLGSVSMDLKRQAWNWGVPILCQLFRMQRAAGVL